MTADLHAFLRRQEQHAAIMRLQRLGMGDSDLAVKPPAAFFRAHAELVKARDTRPPASILLTYSPDKYRVLERATDGQPRQTLPELDARMTEAIQRQAEEPLP